MCDTSYFKFIVFFYSVAYANNNLYVVNGPELREDVIEIRGFIIEMSTGNVISKFGNFTDPHDIAVSDDTNEVTHKIALKVE